MKIGRSISTQIATHATKVISVHGWDASGDFVIGAHKLKTTNLLLEEYNATTLHVRNLADTENKNLRVLELHPFGDILMEADARWLAAYAATNGYYLIKAYKTGGPSTEVARFQGAADPYLQATLPLRLLPIATASLPTTPVEGMITYDDTLKKLVVRSDAAWAPAGLIASGTYTGNDTVNRALPHGLGITPKMVFITGSDFFYRLIEATGVIFWQQNAGSDSLVVTVIDATNFYVGNATSYPQSANENTIAYYWIAIG